MQKTSRKLKGGMLFGIMLFQIVSMTLSFAVPIQAVENSGGENIQKTSDLDYSSHSSPFYFQTNQTSPLMQSDLEESQSVAPKSSYYDESNDFALALYLEKYAINTGEQINFQLLLTDGLIPVQNQYIQLFIYRGFYRDYYSYYSNYNEAELLQTLYVSTDSEGIASGHSQSFSQSGVYTIFCSYSQFEVYEEFSVGNFGIFLKGSQYYQTNQEYKASLQIVNISDFTALSNQAFQYHLEYYNYSLNTWIEIESGSGITDSYGYAIFETSPIIVDSESYYYYGNTLRLSVESSANAQTIYYHTYLYKSWTNYYYSLWNGQQEINQDPIQFVVTSDKTIYNPGEIINLRAIVLEYSYLNETKVFLRNTPIHLTIYTPKELAIFWLDLVSDENGVVEFKFPLDEDCELGNYGFEFSYEEDTYRYSLDVQYYTKPVFQVSINTYGNDFYPQPEGFSLFQRSVYFDGYVEAEYYFGQPVIGAIVQLQIFNYNEELKYSLTGETNGEGRFYFSINLKQIAELDYSFRVNAEVFDDYSRNASFSKYYSRINEIYAYGYVENWAPDPKESVNYYYSAYQLIRNGYYYDYNPLALVDVSIKIYGIIDYPIYFIDLPTSIYLKSFTGKTNIYGSGELEFDLSWLSKQVYQLFQIQISITLSDGRTTESSTYFRYKKYNIDINLENSQFTQGDTLNFGVSLKDSLTNEKIIGEGWLRMYDSQYNMIGQTYLAIDSDLDFSYKLNEFMPSGKYYISTYVYSQSNTFYGGFMYHSAYSSFYVGDNYEITLSTNATEINQNNYEIYVNLGDSIEIEGIINTSTNLPIYLEIYKRGLVDSISLPIINNEFQYTLEIESILAPDFTVIIYTITDSGILLENLIVVHINLAYSIDISTDKEMYEPGDEVVLTITPESNQDSLISLSFIDSALLDVVPEDDSELAYFSSESYYAYIHSGSSWGTGRDGENYWWVNYQYNTGGFYGYRNNIYVDDGYYMDDYALMENTDGGRSQIMTPPTFEDLLIDFETDIRDNISESANWISSRVISEATNFTFKLPDNIGEWTIRAVVNNIDQNELNSNLLWGDIITTKIKTSLPFFVEFQLSEPIFQDDIITVKGYVYNYLGTDVDAYIAINSPNLRILNRETQRVFIPNNMVSEIEFTILCSEAFYQNITLIAATNISGQEYSDAKQLLVYIQPNGIEIINRQVGYLNSTEDGFMLNYSIDPLAIYHKETIAIYTDLMEISIDRWTHLIGYPYGCVEQTLSKLMPTALIHNYLNTTDQLTEDMAQTMNLMILSGLGRIYNFQNPDGGWGWWNEGHSQTQMTALVLYALKEIQQAGFSVNKEIITSGLTFMKTIQKNNSLWEFPYYSANDLEATALIFQILVDIEEQTVFSSQDLTTISSALYNQWQKIEFQSAYGASLIYLAIMDSPYANESFQDTLVTYLLNNFIVTDEMGYWTRPDEYYWSNLGNTVEITAYAAWVLANDGYMENYAVIKKALTFLIEGQNTWGWMSTADSAAAIKSLTEIQKFITTTQLLDFEGVINLSINSFENSQNILNFSDPTLTAQDVQLDIGNDLVEGDNTIELNIEGTGTFTYIFESYQIIRSQPEIFILDDSKALTNTEFSIPLQFTGIDNRMPLQNVSIQMLSNEEYFEISDLNAFQDIYAIENNEIVNLSVIAPNNAGNYTIEGILISGELRSNESSTSIENQFYQRLIGPIQIEVQASTDINKNKQNLWEELRTEEKGSRFEKFTQDFSPQVSQSSNNIELKREISTLKFNPGEIISINISLSNQGDTLNYYALDESIPNGLELMEDSITILIADELVENQITSEISQNMIHFFIPEINDDEITIQYNLMVKDIRKSVFSGTKLWGMYDNFELQLDSVIISMIFEKYDGNATLYRDLILPTLNSIDAKQLDDPNEIKVNIKINAMDENYIRKIRVLFNQEGSWRTKKVFYISNIESFSVELDGLANEDSMINYYLEIVDIYGNILTSGIYSLNVQSRLIPYLIIGIIVGCSVGLAYLGSKIVNKRNIKISQNGKIIPKKERNKDLPSFLGNEEVEIDENLDKEQFEIDEGLET